MKYGSVCSGIEAATQAWHTLGWKPAFFSEIEQFPRAVLKHHYPDIPLHGDFTTIKKDEYNPINLLVGGCPCQSFSVAGLRKGLDDDRGNLSLEFIKLAQRLQPRWILFENVPGMLSIDGGRAFGSFLGGLAELGYGFAYRVLDAQYVRTCRFTGAVPQRRRRVFVVGCIGDWRSAAKVLFDSESLSGNPPPRRKTGEGTAGKVANCLDASYSTKQGLDNQHVDAGCPNFTYGIPGNWIGRKPENGSNQVEPNDNHSPCLTAMDQHAVCFEARQDPCVYGDKSGSLGTKNKSTHRFIQIRRLTVEECEALQGFPRAFTQIPWKDKPADQCPDGPRYRAIGNSMAVNVMHWLGEKIQKYNT